MNFQYLKQKHDNAIQQLSSHVAKHSDVKNPVEIDEEKICNYNSNDSYLKGSVRGWEIYPSCLKNYGYSLHILVDGEFPFSLPKIAINPPPNFLEYPHIEKNGYLCLLDNEAYISNENNFLDACDKIIEDSLKLALQSLNYENIQDFKGEIISYWDRAKDTKDILYYSLLDVLNKKARIVTVCLCNGNLCISEDKKTITHWLENKNLKPKEFNKGALLWLDEVFESPKYYPKDIFDLYNIIKNSNEAEIIKYLECCIRNRSQVFVVIAFDTNDGVALVGVHGTTGANSQTMQKGFRSLEKIPIGIALKRYSSNKSSLEKLNVQRIDASWILSRDSDTKIPKLLKKRVAIIGCGAVGSAVARLLAQAGVGYLQLIDYDLMEWVNIGRHALGADAVETQNTSYKAELLKRQICTDFPHIVIDNVNKKWERMEDKDRNILEKTDLIISATGNWPAENALNKYACSHDNFPPIIYAWTEPFACAGHALCIFKGNGCLDCVFKDSNFNFSMTKKFDKEIHHLPGCSFGFQPFGNIELTPITAMIAEVCVSVLVEYLKTSKIFSWVGNGESTIKNGGHWTGQARGLFAKHGNYGYFRTEQDFKDIDFCYSCENRN